MGSHRFWQVNCRRCIDDIERIANWEKKPALVHWHGVMEAARDLFLTKPPEPTGAPPNTLDGVCDLGEGSGSVGGGRKPGMTRGTSVGAPSTWENVDSYGHK